MGCGCNFWVRCNFGERGGCIFGGRVKFLSAFSSLIFEWQRVPKMGNFWLLIFRHTHPVPHTKITPSPSPPKNYTRNSSKNYLALLRPKITPSPSPLQNYTHALLENYTPPILKFSISWSFFDNFSSMFNNISTKYVYIIETQQKSYQEHTYFILTPYIFFFKIKKG